MTLENLSQSPFPGRAPAPGGIAAWTNEARRGSQCRRLNEVLTGERA
jgi:hypothetical protein